MEQEGGEYHYVKASCIENKYVTSARWGGVRKVVQWFV